MSVKPKIILIHGNGGGTRADNWLPYVKAELEKFTNCIKNDTIRVL